MVELFHRLTEEGSAAARRAVAERSLEEKVRFRNVFYDEARADFARLGGTTTPALWDGEHLVEGTDAVLATLSRLT